MQISLLLVEDDPSHQQLMSLHLTRNGIQDVEVVASLQEAVEACAQRSRDVMVIDSGVLGEDRLAELERLRECAPDARLIGYSAGAREEDWADVHFMKGEDIEGLIEEIRKGSRGT